MRTSILPIGGIESNLLVYLSVIFLSYDQCW
jgi:hypothetical protein